MPTKNSSLNTAKDNQSDEFYTRYIDIEKECSHYINSFKDKIIYCNCDDPTLSNFFAYFYLNFKKFGLKKLISTCYSPAVEEDLWFETTAVVKPAYKIVVEDIDTSITTPEEVKQKIKPELLKGDGDFSTDKECLNFLREADIIVTNPPFSLLQHFIITMFKYKKKFLIIGNSNLINYPTIFPHFVEKELFLGLSSFNNGMYFIVPDDYEYADTYKNKRELDGHKVMRVSSICWYTNLDCPERTAVPIKLVKKYNEKDYPKFTNYNAINVNNYKDIPKDYYDLIGVPITFLKYWDPDQFDLIDCLNQPELNGEYLYARIIIKRAHVKH